MYRGIGCSWRGDTARASAFPARGPLRLGRALSEEEQFYRARDTHWPGMVLFSRRSQFNGNVRVVQWGDNWRSLDFNGTSQGIAYVSSGDDAGDDAGDGAAAAAPEVLGSEYLRVMASAALGYAALNGLDPAAEGARFVFAGLGAGQLPHFLHHHFPDATIQVAEICPVVAQANDVLRQDATKRVLARTIHRAEEAAVDVDGNARRRMRRVKDESAEPALGGGLEVTIADAAVFMADAVAAKVTPIAAGGEDDDDDDEGRTEENDDRAPTATPGTVGALAVFLDAYDGEGKIPAHLQSPAFLASCAAILAPGGVVVANLYNGAPVGWGLGRGSHSQFVSERKNSNPIGARGRGRWGGGRVGTWMLLLHLSR